VRPVVARTASTLAVLAAFGAAAVLAACGAFSSDPGATTDGGNEIPDAAAEATAPDAAADAADAADAATCEVLFSSEFNTLGAFLPQSNDAGPATLSNDPAHAVTPPSLAAVGKLVRATGYLNSSASHDIALTSSLRAGDRLELEYDLFLEDPVASYSEVGCTLELFDANDLRTRLLVALVATGAIEPTFDPADPTLTSLTKTALSGRVAGDYRVKATLAAISAKTANVHFEVGTGTADFADVPLSAPIERLRLVCGIDYANTDSLTPVMLRVWVDDVVVRRCIPKP
jgi:hypothetical protein